MSSFTAAELTAETRTDEGTVAATGPYHVAREASGNREPSAPPVGSCVWRRAHARTVSLQLKGARFVSHAKKADVLREERCEGAGRGSAAAGLARTRTVKFPAPGATVPNKPPKSAALPLNRAARERETFWESDGEFKRAKPPVVCGKEEGGSCVVNAA